MCLRIQQVVGCSAEKNLKIPCYLNTWSIQVAERADQGTGDEVEDDSQLGEKSTRAEE